MDLSIWVSRLKDANPETRLKAIEALEILGGEEALLPLSQVFASDPLLQLRQAAQKAGKTIYQNLLRQAENSPTASEEERRQAAAILEQARLNKQKRS